MIRPSLSKEIFRTLAYADIFDYPLTIQEIHHFLIGQNVKRKTQNEIQKKLAGEPLYGSYISHHDGFYFLKGRREIVATRKKRERWSRQKLKIARRVGNWLRLIPWIKLAGVTGALAMENSDKEDDIDLLVITAPNRLWLSRALAVILMEIAGQRRRPNDPEVRDKICLNLFLDEKHLRLPQKEQNLFTAHEVCQLRPLWDRDGIYEKFLGENRWAKKYLANGLKEIKKLRNGKIKRERSSQLVITQLLSYLESFACRFQLAYMRSRKTREITEPGRILFHPQDCRKWVLEEYQKRLQGAGF